MFQIINLCLNVLHFVLCFFYKSILSNLKQSADEGSHLLSPEASIFFPPQYLYYKLRKLSRSLSHSKPHHMYPYYLQTRTRWPIFKFK